MFGARFTGGPRGVPQRLLAVAFVLGALGFLIYMISMSLLHYAT
jgi:hypothetical protein